MADLSEKTEKFSGKIFFLLEPKVAIKIHNARLWPREKFQREESKKMAADTLVCLSLGKNLYLFLYTLDGGIKIEEASLREYVLEGKKALPIGEERFFLKNQKTLLAKAIGFEKGGYEKKIKVFWA